MLATNSPGSVRPADQAVRRPDAFLQRNFQQVDTCLILSLRHPGDAVTLAAFVNALSERYRGLVVDVLGCRDLCGVKEASCPTP
jgi:hypothetical protein